MLALAVAAGTAGAETRTTEMALTLRDAVARALEGNPGLVDARMDRMLERYDVKEAEEHFKPQWSLGTGTVDYGYQQAVGERDAKLSMGPGVEMRLPTGGQVEAGPRWERTIVGAETGVERAGLVVRITQPLARGAGWEVANAPVAQSALAEKENVLRLRGAVMDVVTEVVTAYRAVMRAALQTEIERRSPRARWSRRSSRPGASLEAISRRATPTWPSARSGWCGARRRTTRRRRSLPCSWDSMRG